MFHNNWYMLGCFVLSYTLSLIIRAYVLICLKLGQIRCETVGTNLLTTPLRSEHFYSRKPGPLNDITLEFSTGSKAEYHGWLLLLGEFRKAECNLLI